MTIKFPCCVELTEDMTFEMLQEIEKIFVKAGASPWYKVSDRILENWKYFGVDTENKPDVWDEIGQFDFTGDGVTLYTYQELIALSKQTDPVSSTENSVVDDKPEGLSGIDFLAEYAKEAEVNDEPWEAFEIWCELNGWKPLLQSCTLTKLSKDIFRRKPVAGIKIGNYEIFPLTEAPEKETPFYVTDPMGVWENHYDPKYQSDTRIINNGFAHTTRESAENHLKALIEYTKQAIDNHNKGA